MALDVLLAYPYFIGNFKTHTNACKVKLGEVINQGGIVITFYIINLTAPQMSDT